MDSSIGETAGDIWNYLEKAGEDSVTGIVDAVESSRSEVQMAIGWLAKEGKLEFNTEGRGTSISLS